MKNKNDIKIQYSHYNYDSLYNRNNYNILIREGNLIKVDLFSSPSNNYKSVKKNTIMYIEGNIIRRASLDNNYNPQIGEKIAVFENNQIKLRLSFDDYFGANDVINIGYYETKSDGFIQFSFAEAPKHPFWDSIDAKIYAENIMSGVAGIIFSYILRFDFNLSRQDVIRYSDRNNEFWD